MTARHFYGVLPGLLALCSLVFFGCLKTDKKDSEPEEVTLDFNYDSLISHAKAFAPETGKPGGTLSLPLYNEPVSFNPLTTHDAVFHMYEGLVAIDGATGLPVPHLAKRWDVSDDGLVWTFKIREGVFWSDSMPFSAYDVVFTFDDLIYNRRVRPNISREKFTIAGRKIGVKALDSLTVQFTLPAVFAPFLRSLCQGILPRHRFKRAAGNGSFCDSLSIRSKPGSMVGTGPFILTSYTPLNNVVYCKNPLYRQRDSVGTRLPYIDSLIYTIVSDLDEALQCFKNGEIDYLVADGKDYVELKGHDSGFVQYHLGPAFTNNFLVFNQNTGKRRTTGKPYVPYTKQVWFRNGMFRKAVALAVDRQHSIDSLMGGRGYAQWSPVNPAVRSFYNPAVRKYPLNRDEAKRILAAEGFADRDGDGFLEDRDSTTIEFSLIVNSGNVFRCAMALLIREDLKKIGMNVHVQQMNIRDIMNTIQHPPYQWDCVLAGMSDVFEPHFGYDVWHSSGKNHLWFPNQKKPSTLWEGRIDSLFQVGTTIDNMVKRKAIYDEWQVIVSTELPVIFTVRSERILCMSRAVQNVNPTLYGGLLHNLPELFFSRDAR